MIINWGDAPFKAFITVNYPGGTCTVTGEGQSYTHTGGGTTTFTVKKKGSYLINVAYSGLRANTSASVESFGQKESVSLTEFYLFKDGVWQDTKMTNMSLSGGKAILIDSNSTNAQHETNSFSTKAIDLTKFSTAKFNLLYQDSSTGADVNYRSFAVGVCSTNSVSAVVEYNISAMFKKYFKFNRSSGASYSNVVAIDIKGYTGNHYLGAHVNSCLGSARISFSEILLCV